MHEFGLCESFVDAIVRRAAGRSVSGVRVRIGALHRVDEGAFQQAFGFVMIGTVAEGAVVDVVTTPALLSCPNCGVETETNELLAACPACGGVSLHIAGGNELVLESIRLAADSDVAMPVGDSVPPEPDDGHVHPQPRGAVAAGGV